MELKLEKLSKRQELERAQRELELKQQLFEQQCVVDEAALEESVWQQAVNEDTDTTTKSTIIPVPLQSSTRESVYHPEATVITEAKVRPEVSQIDAQDNLSTDSTRAETFDTGVIPISLFLLATGTVLCKAAIDRGVRLATGRYGCPQINKPSNSTVSALI